MVEKDIIALVLVKMDELTPYQDGVALPTLKVIEPIEVTIASVIDECVREFLHSSKSSEVQTSATEIELKKTSSGDGYISLPDDIIRLVSFKIQGWVGTINNLVPEGSQIDYNQQLKFLRGGITAPVGVRAHVMEDGKSIDAVRYYPSTDNDDLDHFIYIPNLNAECLDDNIIDGLSWLIASKTAAIVGNNTMATNAMDNYNKFVAL